MAVSFKRIAELFSRNTLCYVRRWKSGFSNSYSLEKTSKFSRTSKSVPPIVLQKIREDLFVNPTFKNRIISASRTWNDPSASSNIILKKLQNIKTEKGELAAEKLTLEDIKDDELTAFMADMANRPRHQFNQNWGILLEDECCKRIQNMNKCTMLYLADAFFVLNIPSNKYFKALFHEFDQRWDKLNIEKEDILQLAFFLSLTRTSLIFLMHRIEEFLNVNMNKFSINEIGLICQAFFTTNISFRKYSVLEQLSSLVVKNMKHERFRLCHVANVMKTMRHAQFSRIDFYEEIGDLLSNKLNSKDVTLSDLATIVFTFSSVRVVHENFMKRVAELITEMLAKKSAEEIRMKDVGRLVWAFVILREPVPKCLLEKLPDAIRRDNMLSRYPEAFVEALVALAVNKTYEQDLINTAFSPRFLELKSGRALEQRFQLLLLNSAVKLECPEYKGNLLTTNYLQSHTKEVFGSLTYELRTRQGLLNFIRTLNEILGGSDFIHSHFLLQHSKITDIELRLDSWNRPVKFNQSREDAVAVQELDNTSDLCLDEASSLSTPSVTQMVYDEEQKDMQRELPENIYMKSEYQGKTRRISIKVMGWNQYALNKPLLLGLHQMELRLLNRLGYDVFVVNPVLAQQLDSSSSSERIAIVSNILKQCDINAKLA